MHGGILPEHVSYGLERINRETQQWLLGGAAAGETEAPAFLRGASSVVWARDYSLPEERRCDCDTLQQVLASIPGAERMVMGHTIQDSISGACGGRALRIDVGLSRGCGDGDVEVLEILDDVTVRRLREGHAPEQLQQPAAAAAAARAGGAAAEALAAAAAAAAAAAQQQQQQQQKGMRA